MRQIIIASGYDCAKVFIYGYLGANTGSCCAKWGWHVAPLVRFRNAAGLVELRILDPSLFNRPATQEEWKKKCEDVYCRPGASVDASATTYGNVYYRDATGWVTYDDNYSKTNCTISYYNQYQGCTFMPTPPCGL